MLESEEAPISGGSGGVARPAQEKNMTARKADDDWVLWNEKSAHGDPERSQSFVVSSQMKHFLFLIKTRKDRLASLSPEQMQQHVVNVSTIYRVVDFQRTNQSRPGCR